MDRVPYRRVSPSRRDVDAVGYQSSREETGDVSHFEALILQCIISGIVLVFVLIASTTSIAPAVALKDGIRQVLAGAETVDELIMDIRQLGTEWLGWAPVEAPIYTPTEYVYEEEAEIEPYQPPTAEEVSKPTVPEPAVIPGLWD